MFLARPEPAAAQEADPAAEAWALHDLGRPSAALATAERRLSEATTPADRLALLRAALDICVGLGETTCQDRLTPAFAEAARNASADPPSQAVLLLEAHYYAAQRQRAHLVRPAEILSSPFWRSEIVYGDRLTYIRRQLLAARLKLESGDKTGADAALDRALSLIVSLKTEAGVPRGLGPALVQSIELVAASGDIRRAYGLLQASREALVRSLPASSPDGVRFRLVEADVFLQGGDAAAAWSAVEAASAGLAASGVEENAPAEGALARIKAALLLAKGDGAGALAALEDAGAQQDAMGLYLRVAASAMAGALDDAAVSALRRLPTDDGHVATLRTAGLAYAGEPAAILELRRRIQDLARHQNGSTSRLGVFTNTLAKQALAGGEETLTAADQDALFAVLQLTSRTAAAQDAEALAALAKAETDLLRRTVHQALRLDARRDELERNALQKVSAGLVRRSDQRLEHDFDLRARLRDYDLRIIEADRELSDRRLSRHGRAVLSLSEVQSVLTAKEALLVASPAAGGVRTYMCVRRDRVVVATRDVDPLRFKLDGRLVQSALTAGHAPSEALDSQYPVEAAVRLYDVLLRPFEGCLKQGERILWLGGPDSTPVPLTALLPQAPAKVAGAYDLGGAAWVMRRHPVSYLGSAALLVASRSTRDAAGGDLDFLGVGDPVLSGGAKEVRQSLARGGVRLDSLAALPETKAELEASARGFPSSRLLLQSAATERSVRSEVLSAYRYLSFATHGLLREELDGVAEPSLVLTPASGDPSDDGLLTASEIADLRLSADFVALSACNTANFDLDAMTEDLPALASAFAIAGAPATLGTLWPVDSLASQTVVSSIFARLRAEGLSPDEALARAQQAFLVAPPDKARLHPRFWAPFVVLGDGGAAPRKAAPKMRLERVEVLTARGGEVVDVVSRGSEVLSLSIGEPDAGGGRSASVRAGGPDGEAWRVTGSQIAASPPLLAVGGHMLAAGYEAQQNGRFGPVLSVVAPAGFRTVWRDESALADRFVVAGAEAPAGGALAVAEIDLRNQGEGGRLQVLLVGRDLAVQPLFAMETPGRASIRSAALANLGEHLLLAVAYELRSEDRPTFDDYDMPACRTRLATRLELRDRATGVLLKEAVLADVAVSTALEDRGRVLLGAARRSACVFDQKAEVMAVDASLAPVSLYLDDTTGASEIRALSRAGRDRIVAAGMKENVVEIRAAAPITTFDPFNLAPYADTSSGMMVLLGDKAPVAELLDSGANIYVDAAAPTESGFVLGGALGGQAALFHLSTGDRPRPR